MPRKTEVNPDEVAMREHGFHVWTSNNEGTYWCRCDHNKDHTTEPRWA